MALAAFLAIPFTASAQKYQGGIVDKTIAVIGNEVITISQLEEEVQMMNAYGMMSDKNARCEVLEQMMVSKLFLMQARVDSLSINNDMVESELRSRIDNVKTSPSSPPRDVFTLSILLRSSLSTMIWWRANSAAESIM
jgi:peptidyl-prolyl cis-trans isomerase SurA